MSDSRRLGDLPPVPDAIPGLVSVVMIFRDPDAAYFFEAVRSVLAQTYADIELLLCDDGSGAAASTFAEGLAAEDPRRIRYVDHPGHAHLGMSATRNLGGREGRGEFFAFLDADDVWLPSHLASDLDLLRRSPEAAAVCGQAVRWRSWSDPGLKDEEGGSPWPVGTVVDAPAMLDALLNRPETPTPTCSLIVRREVWQQIGGSVEQFSTMYEDQAVLVKLYTGFPVVIGAADTALYRQHSRSTTARETSRGTYHPFLPNDSRTRFLTWSRDYLRTAAPSLGTLALIERELSAIDRTPTRIRVRDTVINAVRRRSHTRLVGTAKRLSNRAVRQVQIRVNRLVRPTPVSAYFGYDRGTPIDRYYIERFLSRSAYLIRGAVLEVGDAEYTRRFGGPAVARSDVLNVYPDPGTTVVADLEIRDDLPHEAFDCVLITQTLHLTWELDTAVHNIHDALKPGGVAVVTVPFISQISSDRWADRWMWGISPSAAKRLFERHFGEGQVQVESFGNVRAATAFLDGFAAEELTAWRLDDHDPRYPMLVGLRAFRPTPSDGAPAGAG